MEIGAIIDVIVLLFLGVTIFYAWRLSTYMKIFRDSRKEMEALFIKLDADITRAEKSVLGMRNAAESAGMKLNETIKESKFLSDELKFMNEAGDSLASRLEKLAEKNRALVEKLETAGGVSANTPYRDLLSQAEETERAAPARFADKEAPTVKQQDSQQFASQAERDLYDALQRKRAGR